MGAEVLNVPRDDSSSTQDLFIAWSGLLAVGREKLVQGFYANDFSWIPVDY